VREVGWSSVGGEIAGKVRVNRDCSTMLRPHSNNKRPAVISFQNWVGKQLSMTWRYAAEYERESLLNDIWHVILVLGLPACTISRLQRLYKSRAQADPESAVRHLGGKFTQLPSS
jgi:hypothetical protein